MIKHYLVTTEHLENTLWFHDEEDFKVAMNYIALLAANHPEVIILAFILMSNHVHFVLKGKQKDILCFINKFKGLYSQYMRRKYGTKDFLRRNKVHLKEIGNNPEALERSIAYVQMNSVAANICSNPTQYPWGTGNTFFNPSYPEGKLLKSFSKRALKRILHSDCDTLPKDWLLLSAGYILPKSYVDFRTVESCYHTPKRMNYFNTISSKAKKRIDSGEAVLLRSRIRLSRTLFQKYAGSTSMPGHMKICFWRNNLKCSARSVSGSVPMHTKLPGSLAYPTHKPQECWTANERCGRWSKKWTISFKKGPKCRRGSRIWTTSHT